MTATTHSDIAIIGAGLCGVSMAHVAARQGLDVAIIDSRERYPDVLRAEKIETEQAERMRRLGLLDMRRPAAPRVGLIQNHHPGRMAEFDTGEQYGFRYHDTVNGMRDALPDRVRTIWSKVKAVVPRDAGAELRLADGATHATRLAVVASGMMSSIPAGLGMRSRTIAGLRTLTFGFDIEPVKGEFPFRGLNFYPRGPAAGADYLTVFPIGDVMRVNIFTQWEAGDARVRGLRGDPVAALEAVLPGVGDCLVPVRRTSGVTLFPTRFHRLAGVQVPAVVVIGDAFQAVSPATGLGLDRVFADIEALARRLPDWFATAGMGVEKIRTFYADADKRDADRRALQTWAWYRDRHRSRAERWVARVTDALSLAGVTPSARPRAKS